MSEYKFEDRDELNLFRFINFDGLVLVNLRKKSIEDSTIFDNKIGILMVEEIPGELQFIQSLTLKV